MPRKFSAILWWWEVTTFVAGTVALATIFIIFIKFDNKSTEEWHSKVSMNAIISALSQVVQSALTVSVAASMGQQKWGLFRDEHGIGDIKAIDNATRGPEGSLRYLCSGIFSFAPICRAKSRTRPSPVVLVGAFIILAMLLLQSFVQQSVEILQRSHTLTEPGQLSRLTSFSLYDGPGYGPNGQYLPYSLP